MGPWSKLDVQHREEQHFLHLKILKTEASILFFAQVVLHALDIAPGVWRRKMPWLSLTTYLTSTIWDPWLIKGYEWISGVRSDLICNIICVSKYIVFPFVCVYIYIYIYKYIHIIWGILHLHYLQIVSYTSCLYKPDEAPTLRTLADRLCRRLAGLLEASGLHGYSKVARFH